MGDDGGSVIRVEGAVYFLGKRAYPFVHSFRVLGGLSHLKFLHLSQVISTPKSKKAKFPLVTNGSELVSEIRINKDMIKWLHYLPVSRTSLAKTRLAMVGSDSTIDVMETPEMIEAMCADIQNIRLIKEEK